MLLKEFWPPWLTWGKPGRELILQDVPSGARFIWCVHRWCTLTSSSQTPEDSKAGRRRLIGQTFASSHLCQSADPACLLPSVCQSMVSVLRRSQRPNPAAWESGVRKGWGINLQFFFKQTESLTETTHFQTNKVLLLAPTCAKYKMTELTALFRIDLLKLASAWKETGHFQSHQSWKVY